jgi:hypothetical protein
LSAFFREVEGLGIVAPGEIERFRPGDGDGTQPLAVSDGEMVEVAHAGIDGGSRFAFTRAP